MPIFEYVCNNCKKEFEILVKSNKENTVKCISCNSDSVKKKFSSFAVNKLSSSVPECSAGCGGGFDRGACGSGMCGLQ